MNNKRFFYVVYFADPLVQSCLDLIRYLAEWSEKTPAHVTIRGPYDRRLTQKNEQSIYKHMAGAKVDVLGVSAFLNQHQNTIYLQCSAPEFRLVWDKPNYPFNPHLTLYDGDDKAFANDLLAGLHSCFKQFSITARGVYHIVSVKGERALPTMRLSIELASEALGVDLENDVSTQDHRDIRLTQIFHIYQFLQNYCSQADNFPSSTRDTLLTGQTRSPERPSYRVVDRKNGSFLSTVPEV